MKLILTFLTLILLLTSCKNNLNQLDEEFCHEITKYLTDTFNFQIPHTDTYFLFMNVDCYSCNEKFLIDFSEQDIIPNLVPIISGREGSEIIKKGIVLIKKKYPNFLIDKQKNVDRYRISESGKNVLVKYNNTKPKKYWDLGSGKYTNTTNGEIQIASIINMEN